MFQIPAIITTIEEEKNELPGQNVFLGSNLLRIYILFAYFHNP